MHSRKLRALAASALAVYLAATSATAAASTAPSAQTGNLAQQKFYAGGYERPITAYNIGGYNYLRLRDLGGVLNFAVDYDAETDTIDIDAARPYTGDTYQPPGAWPQTVQATPTTQTVRIGGAPAAIGGYSIGGYNYFKLRELARALDFSVVYNGALEAVELDKSAHYFEQQGNTIVLMYHAFCETEAEAMQNPSLYTTVDRLRQNIAALRQQGFLPLSLEDYYDGKAAPDKKYFILTIDDGYMDNYTLAWPVLQEEQVHADIFSVVQDLSGGRDSHFGYDKAREMEQSGSVSIHSHNLRHVRTTAFSDDELLSMLNTSYRSLSQELRKNTLFFAYPYGDHSKTSYQLVKKAGYKLQLVQGRKFAADDMLVRMDMYYDTDIPTLIQTAVYN